MASINNQNLSADKTAESPTRALTLASKRSSKDAGKTVQQPDADKWYMKKQNEIKTVRDIRNQINENKKSNVVAEKLHSLKRHVTMGKQNLLARGQTQNLDEADKGVFDLTYTEAQYDVPEILAMDGSVESQAVVDSLHDKNKTTLENSIRQLKENNEFAKLAQNWQDFEQIEVKLRLAAIDQKEKLENQHYNLLDSNSSIDLEKIDENLANKHTDERLEELRQLAKQYALPHYTLKETKQTKRQLMNAFLAQSNTPYLNYKVFGDIDRTLIKKRYIEQPPSAREIAAKKLIEQIKNQDQERMQKMKASLGDRFNRLIQQKLFSEATKSAESEEEGQGGNPFEVISDDEIDHEVPNSVDFENESKLTGSQQSSSLAEISSRLQGLKRKKEVIAEVNSNSLLQNLIKVTQNRSIKQNHITESSNDDVPVTAASPHLPSKVDNLGQRSVEKLPSKQNMFDSIINSSIHTDQINLSPLVGVTNSQELPRNMQKSLISATETMNSSINLKVPLNDIKSLNTPNSNTNSTRNTNLYNTSNQVSQRYQPIKAPKVIGQLRTKKEKIKRDQHLQLKQPHKFLSSHVSSNLSSIVSPRHFSTEPYTIDKKKPNYLDQSIRGVSESKKLKLRSFLPSLNLNTINSQTSMQSPRNFQTQGGGLDNSMMNGLPQIQENLAYPASEHCNPKQRHFFIQDQETHQSSTINPLASGQFPNMISNERFRSIKSDKRMQVSPERQKLQSILTEIQDFSGKDPKKSAIQQINSNMAIRQMEMQFRAHAVTTSAQRIQEHANQSPAVMDWMIQEENETINDECETQRQVMQKLDNHKRDITYNMQIENRIRHQLTKIRMKKK